MDISRAPVLAIKCSSDRILGSRGLPASFFDREMREPAFNWKDRMPGALIPTLLHERDPTEYVEALVGLSCDAISFNPAGLIVLEHTSASALLRLAFAVSLLISAPGCTVFDREQDGRRTYPEAFDYLRVSIELLGESTLATGRYNVEGIAVRVNHCPPCPREALCVPCPPEGIFLSTVDDTLRNLDHFPYPVVFVSVRTLEGDQFERGARYLASVHVQRDGGAGTYDKILLLGYSEVAGGDRRTAYAGRF